MTRRTRAVQNVLILGFCAIWIFASTHSIGVAQPVDLEPNGIPYRRVFVPSRDLDALGIETFSAIDIRTLEKLLQKDAETRRQDHPSELTTDTSDTIRLKSAYYVAKLVGADLLSECSQLTLVGTPFFGDRLTLSPWSLAVQSPIIRGIKSESQVPTNWLFDEQGFPRISVSTNGPAGAVDSKNREFLSQFGWSARADSTSTPNKLRFSFDIPKCANSCLVLAMPPYAEVQECSTVATRVNDWSEIDGRLVGWNDLRKDFTREPGAESSPESLWLIELGGSPIASFSISLGAGTRPQDDRNMTDGHRYNQLIRSQGLEHFVDGQDIRTICDAEIFVAPEKPRLRMNLADGSKLRRLSVNQQEVKWEVNDGWIESEVGAVLKGSAASSPVNVVAEILTPLSIDTLDNVNTPRILFDRGYVMTGTTVVQGSSPWRFTHVTCDASRIIEPQSDAKFTSVNRLEYTWYATPPSLVIGLEKSRQSRRCEVITHLSNDAKGTTAVVRAKLFFAEQDTSHVDLEVLPSWNVLSVRSIDQNDPATVAQGTVAQGTVAQATVAPGTLAPGTLAPVTSENKGPAIVDKNTLRLSWDRVQKSRVCEFELSVFRNADDLSNPSRHLANTAVLQMPGWKRSNTLVVEDNGLFELRLNDVLLDLMATEESIPDWQRPLLSRMGKHKIFTTELHSLDGSVESRTKTVPEFIASPDQTALDWTVKPNRHQASTMTEIDHASETQLRARHQILLNLSSDRNEPISIHLQSDNVVWRLKSGSDWAPLAPLGTRADLKSNEDGVWRFDPRQMTSECTVLAVVQTEENEKGEVKFPVPSVLNADMQSQNARSRHNDLLVRTVGTPSTWSIDDSGRSFLQCNPYGRQAKIVLAVESSQRSFNEKWFVLGSECHLAIDTLGSQKATLIFRSNTSIRNAIRIQLDDGWEPLAVKTRAADRTVDVPFRIEGRRLIVGGEREIQTGATGLQIDLIGPRLPKDFGFPSQGEFFSFGWPYFKNDANSISQRKALWLPSELALSDTVRVNSTQLGYRWPLWQWSRQSLAVLFGMSAQPNPFAPHENQAISELLAVPLDTRPKWAAHGWRAISIDSPEFESQSSNRTSLDPTTYVVHRIDSDRTYLALVFTLLMLLTPRIILLRFHVAALVAACLIVCSHFAPIGLARFATTGLTGMSLGFMAFVIYRMLSRPLNVDKSISQRHSAKWSANLGTSAVLFVFGWGLALLYSIHSQVIGDDRLRGENSPVYQILIPIDESGAMAGTTAYVPAEMLNVLNGNPDRAKQSERGTHPISARHSLRVGLRGRFNSGDQITMVYEFMVGEDLAPVRFPMNASQLLLPRFSVDGSEINLSNKLKSTGFEWIWTPNSSGKHLVQIIAQPVLKSNELDPSRESLTKLLDIAILPIASATLDIETDPKNSLEIASRGRVNDPTEGRFVVMLGAMDRLRCSVISPLPRVGSGLSFPTTNVVEGAETPVMHTELFLQNEILQAKTIIDFPKGTRTGREIEIEADLQWLPIGTQWGDAEWVETRSGSTLSKRRYILDWKNASTSPSSALPAVRDRQISVVWVPESANQSLNVLFAECRERGTRRGTLRYSRGSGANWSIEGVGAWVPAIGLKDRLDWPELKTNLLATSLRIPSSGGFGILKPKSLLDRPQQARVTTKWSIDANRENLTSRIELLPGSAVSEPLVFQLQDDFVVTELYNRSGPIRYLLNRSQGKLHLQVLAERKSLEVSDLWIQAKRLDSEHWQNNGKWFELPWLTLPATMNCDQTLEIVASENTAFRLESEPGWIYGKGQSTSALNLAKSYTDIHATALASSRYQILLRNKPLVGKLSLTQDLESNPRELGVSAQFLYSASSRPAFVMQVPSSLKDRWQSESRISVIPCPDLNHAWLQVHLPEPSTTEMEKWVSTVIRFPLRPEDVSMDSDWVSRIRAVDERIPTIMREDSGNIAIEKGAEFDVLSNALKAEQSVLGLSATRSVLSVLDDHYMPVLSERNVLMESQYWIQDNEDTFDASRELEWRLLDGVEVLAIHVNGQPVEFQQDDRKVHFPFVSIGICADVRMYSKHPIGNKPDGVITLNAPELVGIEPSIDIRWMGSPQSSKIELYVGGKRILKSKEINVGSLVETCLRFLELGELRWPNAVQLEPGSELARWRKHWGEQATAYLKEWLKDVGADEYVLFSQAIQKWHSLAPLAERRLWTKADVGLGFAARETGSPFAEGSNGAKIASMPWSIHQAEIATWISILGCFIILVCVAFVAPAFGARLTERPWWSLLLLGLFAWFVFGSVLPTLVLGSIGLIVATDSYWMIIARLRQTGLRGLRSL